jgi:hypothetical protein
MTGSAMADGVQISGDLEEWARTAGYSLTPIDPYGRAVFSSRSGEIRYFIGRGNDRWFRVTCSNRSGPEQLELAAPELSTIETYLYGFFGSDVRDKGQLAQAIPVERLPGGFDVRLLTNANQDYLPQFDDTNRYYLAQFDDTNRYYLAQFDETNRDYLARSDDTNLYYLALFDDRGGVTAVDGFDEVLARIRLSDLAVYLTAGTEEVKASFRHPDGGRLLTVNLGEVTPG